MIRIISIVWYKIFPPRFGGQKGIAFFNNFLAKYYPVICLCSRNNESADDMSYELITELPVNKLQFLNPFCWIKIIGRIKEEKCTHVILEHPYHGIAGYLAKKYTGIKLIIHSHNIEFLRFKKQHKWWWKFLFWYEKWAHNRADLNFFKTEVDLDTAIKHFALKNDKCLVVPFGINKNIAVPGAKSIICSKHQIPLSHKILLFAGTLDYKPNADAVAAIYREIVERLLQKHGFNFVIIVCGRNYYPQFQFLKGLRHTNIINAGYVDDIGSYFAAADVFVSPVISESGIQTKIIEALSYNLNTVIFKQRQNGLKVNVCGKKIFCAADDDWEDFADQVVEATRNSLPTPETFFDYYNWTRIVQSVQVAIDRL